MNTDMYKAAHITEVIQIIMGQRRNNQSFKWNSMQKHFKVQDHRRPLGGYFQLLPYHKWSPELCVVNLADFYARCNPKNVSVTGFKPASFHLPSNI